MDLKAFFEELKRRKVYRVAVGYAVIAWLIIQIATQVFPFFAIPSWAVRLTVLLLVIGFPIALVLSWAFELTPEGIRREVVAGSYGRRSAGRKFTALILIIAAIAAGLMTFRFVRSPEEPAKPPLPGGPIEGKSIAVLPFASLSEEKANTYFAEGIQDEILTRLSKIADLRVISRTSTLHYANAPQNVPEIARQLGVAHILEGSVQKIGDRVRVNVQLIRARDDSHLWAQIFDRNLGDIFSVESEVAKTIADQLRAHLTGQEEEVVASRPTDNPDAYDAYLRGLTFTSKTQNTPANYLSAQRYLQEAVRLDRKFALAWALLSYVDSRGYRTLNLQPTVALREEARQAAETALSLQPTLGEAWLAKGYYSYGCVADFDEAIRCLLKAQQYLPNSSRIAEALASIARNQGQWDRSEYYFNQAERFDPRNVGLLTQHGQFYLTLRRLPEARAHFDLILEIVPNDIDALVEKAAIAQAEGDLTQAANFLVSLQPSGNDPTAWETLVYQAILERRTAEIIPRFRQLLASPDPALGYLNGELRFWLGWAEEVAGDSVVAHETWRTAKEELQTYLKDQPDNFSLLGDLALVTMGLQDKEGAFALVERCLIANPVGKDAANAPQTTDIRARIAARLGEPDRAIASLQEILSHPGNGALATGMGLTPALLRRDPMFDSLRNDPRFKELAAAKP